MRYCFHVTNLYRKNNGVIVYNGSADNDSDNAW